MRKWKKFSTAVIFTLVLAMTTPLEIPNLQTYVAAATKISISKKAVTIYAGKTYTLKITGTSKTVKWSSSKKSVATVSSKGKITAKKAGKAVITATVNHKKYTCKVTVKKSTQTTVYGQVTAISGKKVTLALGTLNSSNGQVPSSAVPSASSSGTETGSDSQSGGVTDSLTLTGKKITITISNTKILSKENVQGMSGDKINQVNKSETVSSTATASAAPSAPAASNSSSSVSLSDITEGSILKVTYKNNSVKNLVSVVIMGTDQPEGGQDGGSGNSSTVNTGTGAYNLTDKEALTGGTYTSTNADENAIRAENGITASLTDVAVEKTGGAASSNDASSFYGLNAAVLALGNSVLNITGGSVNATTEGSNGVFAYDGATINIKNTVVNVSGGNSGGIEVAGGGIMNATNLTVNSANKAAIRSDRGGGTMTVNGGSYITSGSDGAPAIYSTAAITANNAVLTANASEAIVVEGLNSVNLKDCTVTGNMTGTYGSSSKNIHNVMLYQSMSGDSEVGTSSFTMTDGTLTSKNGDMFYVTNTDCLINLSDVDLNLAEGTNLLVVAGNDGSRGWGSAGSNGGDCTFTVSGQTLEGGITVDSISKLAMTIKNSSVFKGAINSDKTTAAALSVTLDSSSTWTLTGDSYITEFSGSMDQVNLNGYTLYVNGVAEN